MRLFIFGLGVILSSQAFATNQYSTCMEMNNNFKNEEFENARLDFPQDLSGTFETVNRTATIKVGQCIIERAHTIDTNKFIDRVKSLAEMDITDEQVIQAINEGYIFTKEFQDFIKSEREKYYLENNLSYKNLVEKEIYEFDDKRIKIINFSITYKEHAQIDRIIHGF